MNKLVGQHMIIGISGKTLTADEKDFIVDANIGGVILMGRNVESPEQVHQLCTEIQALRHKMIEKTPLFIAIDMEGGRVARLKAPFTIWPPLKKIGDLDNSTATFSFSYQMGQELSAVGINLDFAPCLDVLTNTKNTAIGDRAISSKVEMVDKHASALIRGFIKAGVFCCAKHFPGHGNTIIDSHDDLPIEDADEARLEKVEYVPFKKAFKSRVDMVMTSHLKFPKIDKDWPVSLSPFFVQQKIRTDFRYRGLIVTDDLDMKALTKNFDKETIAVQALKAGNDLLLYCNDPESPQIAHDAILSALAQGAFSKEYLQESYLRITGAKKERMTHPDPMPFDEAKKYIGTEQNKALAEGLLLGKIEFDKLTG